MKLKQTGRWLIILSWVINPAVWGEVIELPALTVEGYHFDSLSQAFAGGVVRLERSDIESSGAATVPEILERMAGLRFRNFTGNSSEGQLAMRGFGENSGLRVLVLVDGQVFNPPDMGGINWQGIDLDELETVEVLRGGQTVLYGNHAVSGVIKLRTRAPRADGGGNLKAELGSDGTSRVHASMESAIGWLALRAGGGVSRTDGWRDGSAMEARTGYLFWQAGSPASSWTGRLRYNDSQSQLPGPLSWEAFLENPRQSVSGGIDRSDGEEWQATVHGRGQSSVGKWEIYGGGLQRKTDWRLDGKDAANRLRRGNLSGRIKLGDTSRFLIAGGDLIRDVVDYSEYLDPDRETELAWAEIDRLTGGGYLFGSVELDDDWILSVGMRVEKSTTENRYVHYILDQLLPELVTNRGTVPNPAYKSPPDPDPELSFKGPVDKSGWAAELSAIRQISKRCSIWAGWDRVYRYPSVDETASYQGFPLTDPLNEELDPETGNNFETGIKLVGTNWQFGLTGYLLLMADEINYLESVVDGERVRLNTNIGDTRRIGMELYHSYQTDRYGFSGSLNWVDANFRGDLRDRAIPLVPEYDASASGWWRPTLETRFLLQLRYLASQVQGNDFDGMDRRIPGYLIANAVFEWVPAAGISLSFGVNNLFDKAHVVTAYSGGFYPGAGRQFFIRGVHRF